MQPTKGTWDFRKFDAVINNDGHPWVIEVYGAVGCAYPFKAAFSRRYLESLGGKREITDHIIAHTVDMSDPEQRRDAETYVKTLVSRYKNKVKYWEIGNEGIQVPEAYDIITNTYQWIKEVHPDAVVLVTAGAG